MKSLRRQASGFKEQQDFAEIHTETVVRHNKSVFSGLHMKVIITIVMTL
jgi:hypothetical protein